MIIRLEFRRQEAVANSVFQREARLKAPGVRVISIELMPVDVRNRLGGVLRTFAKVRFLKEHISKVVGGHDAAVTGRGLGTPSTPFTGAARNGIRSPELGDILAGAENRFVLQQVDILTANFVIVVTPRPGEIVLPIEVIVGVIPRRKDSFLRAPRHT